MPGLHRPAPSTAPAAALPPARPGRALLHGPVAEALPAWLPALLAEDGREILTAAARSSADLTDLARDCATRGGLDLAAHFIPQAPASAAPGDIRAAWEAGFLSAFRFARILLPAMAPRGRIVFVQADGSEPLPATSLRIFARHAAAARNLGAIRLRACALSRAGEVLLQALQEAQAPRPRPSALAAPLQALGRGLPDRRFSARR